MKLSEIHLIYSATPKKGMVIETWRDIKERRYERPVAAHSERIERERPAVATKAA